MENPSPGERRGTITTGNPHIDRWFTNTSANKNGFGFGLFNPNTGTSHCGPLGVDIEETQAALAAIFICCMEIKATNGNLPIIIYTDSLGAIKTLGAYKIESKLVNDCVEMLSETALHRHITIAWTPSIIDEESTVRVRSLAKEGATMKLYGPAPFFPITDRKYRQVCKKWTDDDMRQRWQNTIGCSHTKIFIESPDPKLTNQLLELSKAKVCSIVSLITGHIGLNKHLKVLGIRDDPDCDRCGGGMETAAHFLCECPGYNNMRKDIFGSPKLTAREIVSSKIWRLHSFASRSGRFPMMEPTTTTRLTLNRSNGRYTGVNAVPSLPPRPPQQTIG